MIFGVGDMKPSIYRPFPAQCRKGKRRAIAVKMGTTATRLGIDIKVHHHPVASPFVAGNQQASLRVPKAEREFEILYSGHGIRVVSRPCHLIDSPLCLWNFARIGRPAQRIRWEKKG